MARGPRGGGGSPGRHLLACGPPAALCCCPAPETRCNGALAVRALVLQRTVHTSRSKNDCAPGACARALARWVVAEGSDGAATAWGARAAAADGAHPGEAVGARGQPDDHAGGAAAGLPARPPPEPPQRGRPRRQHPPVRPCCPPLPPPHCPVASPRPLVSTEPRLQSFRCMHRKLASPASERRTRLGAWCGVHSASFQGAWRARARLHLILPASAAALCWALSAFRPSASSACVRAFPAPRGALMAHRNESRVVGGCAGAGRGVAGQEGAPRLWGGGCRAERLFSWPHNGHPPDDRLCDSMMKVHSDAGDNEGVQRCASCARAPPLPPPPVSTPPTPPPHLTDS